jgi:hypothetical protein
VIVLSEQEIVVLTKKVRPSAQKRVLDALGIPAKPRGSRDPSLVVLRIHVESGEGAPTKRSARLMTEPVLQP